jgi:nicotinamide mononucleotide transporter
MLDAIIQGFADKSSWEWVAVVLALAYVILAAKENIWCWPAALGSTIIYTWLFYDVSLLMESALNVYYMVMAVYGFLMWRNGSNSASHNPLQISSWSLQKHLVCCAVLAVISLILGWIMSNYTHADFAYLDSATTVFAVFTTWLVAKKVLENWLYWIVIDFVSIYLYFSKSMMPTAALFVIYVVIAFMGYIQWQKRFQQNLTLATS